MKQDARTLSVTEAGQLGGRSYAQTMRLLLLGQLTGHKQDGRWRIDAASVERLRAALRTANRDAAPGSSAV